MHVSGTNEKSARTPAPGPTVPRPATAPTHPPPAPSPPHTTRNDWPHETLGVPDGNLRSRCLDSLHQGADTLRCRCLEMWTPAFQLERFHVASDEDRSSWAPTGSNDRMPDDLRLCAFRHLAVELQRPRPKVARSNRTPTS